jgi:pimeloyl-ACP methyl ester carboxylesterase
VALLQREVVVEGVRLRYLEREAGGDAGKPALVFLHGLVASAETFAALIAEMPAEHRVIALDLPGKDLAKQSDVRLASLAGLVRGFFEAVGVERPVLLGHSHGGAVTMQLAVMFPESVGGLILLCPAHPFLMRERRLIAFYNSRVGGLVARSFRWFPMPFQGIGFKRLMGPKGRAAKVDFRPYRTSLNDLVVVGSVLRLIKTWNEDMNELGRRLEAEPIRLPVLFLWGDRDPVVPIASAPLLQRYLTRWEQFTLRGVGHLPNDEVPRECGGLIRTWLMWLETGRLARER